MDEEDLHKIAGRLYEVYCKSVGGKSVSGDLLPTWTELCKDPSKIKVMNGWRDVAYEVKKNFI